MPLLPSRSVTSSTALLAALAFSAVAVLVTSTAATAAATQTQFSAASFTQPTATGVLKPTAPAGANAACLTAGTSTSASPLPGCGLSTPDAAGSGALRLTSATGNQEGGVGSTQSIPISKGLDTVFDSYQYGGTSADGIVFYLAVTDPLNPSVPTTIGSAGGSLGYSAQGTTSVGLANGYLGLGIDVYGNFYNNAFGGTGCAGDGSGSGTTEPAVAVRGPGNGTTGYCLLGMNRVGVSGSTALHGSSRATADVPIEVIINPSATATPSNGFGTKLTSVSVPAMSYAIVYQPIGQAQAMLSGPLPTYSAYSSVYAGKSSWFNSAGLPYKLTYGWVASTGGQNDIHEVNQFAAQTVNGPVPSLTAQSSVDTASPATGSTGTFTVTPAVGTGGTENENVVVTTTFPTGTTAPAYGSTGTAVGDYSCTTSGQVVTCTDPTAGTNVPAGTTLGSLALPYTASGAPGTSGTISSVVSSVDATAVSTSQTVSVVVAPTVTTLTSSANPSTIGASTTLTASIAPAAGGAISGAATVTFTDTTNGATLCANVPVTGSTATCTTSSLPLGSNALSATYSGNASFGASSGTLTQTVALIATNALTAAVSPATVEYGSTATLTATGLASGATGTVVFTAPGVGTLCQATVSGTTASCTSPAGLVPAAYPVTASYSGDTTHASATSVNTPDLTVTQAVPQPVATADGSSADSVTYGTQAALDVSGLSSAPAGATAPTGTVTYQDASGAALCTVTLPTTGCPTSATLPAGTYSVTAAYSGDALYAAAVSPAIALTVTKAPTQLTSGTGGTGTGGTGTGTGGTGTGSGTGTTIVHGGTTTFVVSGLPAGATGTVIYRTASGATLCTVDLSTGNSCTTSAALAGGVYDVTPVYSGDANHAGSTGVPLTLTVSPQSIAMQLHTSVSHATFGAPVTLTAVGLPAGATGTVVFTVGSAVLCTTTLPTTACTTDAILPGTAAVVASYSGDASYAATRATATVVIDPLIADAATPVQLAFTGSVLPIGLLVMISGMLVAAGTALVLLRRRQKESPRA